MKNNAKMPAVKKIKSPKFKKDQKAKQPVENEAESVEPAAAVSGQLQKKIKKQVQREARKRGIVFIKHLPHGFFEEQIKNYFEQFGTVTRLRLARSKHTGGSKGYAFVEFEYPEVAQVAAETMNNYLMFHKLVKASYIPPEKQKLNYFKTSVTKVTNKAGKEIYVSSTTKLINRKVKEHNNWSESNYNKRASRALKKLNVLNKKFGHLGIDFSSVLIAPQTIQTDPTTTEHTKASKSKAKRKNETEKTKKTKGKKDLELADLLGNTLNEDSADEDFVPLDKSSSKRNQRQKKKDLTPADLLSNTLNEDSDDDNEYVPFDDSSSNEDSYMIEEEPFDESRKTTRNKKTQDSLEQDSEDEEEEEPSPKAAINKKKSILSKKNKSNALELKLLKGGKVQKQKVKPNARPGTASKPSETNERKKSLQIAAAKQIAKPLKAVKAKAPPPPAGKNKQIKNNK